MRTQPSQYKPKTPEDFIGPARAVAGVLCRKADAERIFKSLGDLVRGQFPGIEIGRYVDGQGSSETTGPDDAVIEEIDRWVSENWTAAL